MTSNSESPISKAWAAVPVRPTEREQLPGDIQTGGSHPDTVFDDGAADLLIGGADRDWFFANLSGSGVRDLIADLGSKDFTDDLVLVQSLDQ